MKLLAIDTSSDACSVALGLGLGQGVGQGLDESISERHEIAPRRHGELVLRFVDELMGEAGLDAAQLDGVVLGRGPGSFTGVRIAAGVLQGIAFGLELPVACVSSLAALAQGADAGHVVCAQDARRQEVYAGAFERQEGLMHPATPEQVCEPAQVTIPHGGRVWLGVGAGFEAYGPALRQRLGDALNRVEPAHRYPRARDALHLGRAVLEAGEGVDAVRALPVYLREEVADRGRR